MSSFGQQWTGILDSSRAINWAANSAGVVGGIPNSRTTICSTLNPGATADQINTAIQNCNNGVVQLNAGSYILSTGIIFNGKSNVTLRGAGPDSTFLKFASANSCDGHNADICVFGFSGCEDCGVSAGNISNWTAGYAQGTTTITLSSTAGMAPGMMLQLSQANDAADTGGIWVNDTLGVGSIEGVCGPNAGAQKGYCQNQVVTVTGISGNQVTISPGLYETNWRGSQSPRVWWTGSAPSTGVGIEALSADNSAALAYSIISFHNTRNGWIRNVRTMNGTRNHVALWMSSHIEVRDSYFYGTQNAASQSYGIEPEFDSDSLVINNIFQHVTSPVMMGNDAGSIFAYNYAVDMFYSSVAAFMQTSYFGSHDAGTHMMLFEGNDGTQVLFDTFHGAGGNQTTFFRTYLAGVEPGKTGGTVPVAIWANNRAHNFIGNVLGTSGYHNTYQAGTCANCIYSLGDAAWPGSPYQGVAYDPKVVSSLMRWGNYDSVTGTVRWVASEVPTAGITFVNGNPVPATHSLPASFFLPTQPAWWTTPWGTPPWPAIGPDVTGGNVANGAGHVYKNPARLCYEHTPSFAGVLNFNAGNCYTLTASTRPAPPWGLTSIVLK